MSKSGQVTPEEIEKFPFPTAVANMTDGVVKSIALTNAGYHPYASQTRNAPDLIKGMVELDRAMKISLPWICKESVLEIVLHLSEMLKTAKDILTQEPLVPSPRKYVRKKNDKQSQA